MRRDGTMPRAIRSVFEPLIAWSTYTRLVYLLLAFPIGILYGMLIGFGVTVGVATSVVLVGLVILSIVLVLARLLVRFEVWLANRLLAVDLDVPLEQPPRGLRATAEHVVRASETWRGLGFLSMKFWVGIAGIVLLVGYSTALSLLGTIRGGAQQVEFGEINGDPVVWSVETLPETAAAVLGGVLVLLVLLHLTKLFGYIVERMALALLG